MSTSTLLHWQHTLLAKWKFVYDQKKALHVINYTEKYYDEDYCLAIN
jgi:hypothetical protein